VVTEVEAYLLTRGARPNFLFLHFREPDREGHDHGWMSDTYGAAVRRVDAALARALAAADSAFGAGGYTVILTADHGGLGDGHGGADPRETTIPWILWGRGVEPGGPLDRPVHIADSAPTALRLLGIAAPRGWEGRAVEAAATARPPPRQP
jgi:arylsulfatase A-like enzyme